MSLHAIPPHAFSGLSRSIRKYCSDVTDRHEIPYILSHCYLANHKSCAKAGIEVGREPIDAVAFAACLNKRAEPYHTPVQLCKSLRFLIAQVDKNSVCPASRRALNNLSYWIFTISDAFMNENGSRLDDNQSTYRLCHWGLVPPTDEPKVSLLRDIHDAYARLRKDYLIQYRPDLFESLNNSYRLEAHLKQVNRHALDTRSLLGRCLLDMPSACGCSQMAIDHRYHLREKIEEVLLNNIIYNDRMWDVSSLPIYH